MAKNNFSFEKRRKELAKKAKKEEKKNRKLEGTDRPEGEADGETPAAEGEGGDSAASPESTEAS